MLTSEYWQTIRSYRSWVRVYAKHAEVILRTFPISGQCFKESGDISTHFSDTALFDSIDRSYHTDWWLCDVLCMSVATQCMRSFHLGREHTYV
jgi:hypothetical protein